MLLLLLACTQGATDTADVDLDGDGFGASVDCDNHDLRAFPGAAETCNGQDDDCDGEVDEGVTLTFYRDSDGDGYGDPQDAVQACEVDSGYVADGSDCDDGQALVHPGADEDCTLDVDMNCDGRVGLVDSDGDGWPACEECDDADPDRHPDADERCNFVDDDCDGVVDDEAVDALTWYVDADGDGYGDETRPAEACLRPQGHADNAGDCDDGDAQVNPAQWEVCNGQDDDCDLDTDEDALGATDWYLDDDGDGYGDPSVSTTACDAPTDHVDDDSDCDDSDPDVNPGEAEVCDEVDNDCDGSTDGSDAIDAGTWYLDLDGDGYGDANTTTLACDQPTNYGANAGDCLDSDSNVYPGNGCEADCQELYDDGWTTDGVYAIDPDGVGSGNAAFDVYCDMTLQGGGWTAVYWVTADYFDGYYMNNFSSSSSPPSAVNTEKDIWNAESVMTVSETLFVCTTQNDANEYWWYYSNSNPHTYFANTSTAYNYQTMPSSSSNTTAGSCFSAYKAEHGYGFVVIESGGCGSCSSMLYGMYHYSAGNGCNSTSTTYGSHTSPWDNSRNLQYPICGGQQTSNGTFMVLVR